MTAPRFPKPEPQVREREPRAGAAHRALRVLGALVLVAAAVVVVWQQAAVRDGEASLAGHWFGTVLSGSVGSSRDVIWFGWVHGPAVGMQITSECTVALLLGPLFLLGAGLLAFTKARWNRLIFGLAAGMTVVVVVNQLRLAMIAVSTQHWGIGGYDVSHKFVGTLFALAGFAAAALLMLKIGTKRTRRAAHAC